MDNDVSQDVSSEEKEIKSMKLYRHVDRVYNELKEMGYRSFDSLKVEDVCKFDQYHYHQTEAIDKAIQLLSLKSGQTVLDVGSGLGGPARYMAAKCQCHVIAVELQEDLNETAKDLTRKCGLADNVRHVHGNFITDDVDAENVDVITSWLVFLHIKEKDQVFRRCREALKPQGKLYIEDYFLRGTLTAKEQELLNEDLSSPLLLSRDDYVRLLSSAGLTDIKFEDLTSDWVVYVKDRAADYREARDRHVRVHGAQVYSEQQDFFDAVATLFQGGNVGGCCIVASAE